MAAIAGISGRGHRTAMLEMLGTLRHRAKGELEIIENDLCTLGIIHGAIPGRDTQIFRQGLTRHVTGEDSPSCVCISLDKLFLKRDPLGVTPLYYGFNADGNLCFASEVKALLKQTRLVHELPPGTISDGHTHQTYFRLAAPTSSADSPEVLAATLRELLGEVVRQTVSGSVMGAWLSGGLDSSAIAALARPHVKTLHTFVAGLNGSPDLEAAQAVADFIKARHHRVVVSTQDLLRALPPVIYHLESFDALLVRSSLTNYLAGLAARDYVAEVFSGEGGDELFAGYGYLKSIPKEDLADELIDITNRLHNTALQRVDRCASAHALTPLVCFLAPSMVQFALSVPVNYKLKNGTEKWIVRQAIREWLPPQITHRPKAKFWEGAGVGERLAEHAEQQITDADFTRERILPNGWNLATKEELLYYRVFHECFGDLESLDWMGRTKGAPSRNPERSE